MMETWQLPMMRTGNWSDLSHFLRSLHHDLPEFVTFNSDRARTRTILKSQSSIANAVWFEMHHAVEAI
jgi:hypothetical protein